MWDADVVIVGAGPAGSGLAIQLVRKGVRVLLLDKEEFPREKTCGDGLTPRAVAVLERMGLLNDLLQELEPYRVEEAVLFSPSGHLWRMHFDHAGFGLPGFGLIVPRYRLDRFLVSKAVESGAEFLGGSQVVGFVRDSGKVVGVRIDSESGGRVVKAPLVAIATGANIGLHRELGLLQSMPPVVLSARGYFTNVSELGHAMEFYFESELMPGYAWIFPVDEKTANIGVGVFPGTGRRKNPYKMLNWFMREGQAAGRLTEARLQGQVKGYPLRTDYPSHPTFGDGFIMLGESIGLVNPVTGEGIDLALESAELAAEAVEHALERGDFSRKTLVVYEKMLRKRFGSYFSGMRVLRDRAVRPEAMDRIIRAASRDPKLARTVAGINLGVISPQAVLRQPKLVVRLVRYLAKRFFRRLNEAD